MPNEWCAPMRAQPAGPRAGRGLLANSLALLAKGHITALLGYVFWTVCARGVSASTIGMVSTAISAMTLAAILAAGGFEPFLARVLPGASTAERSGLFGTALALTGVLSGVGGVLGALLLPGRVHAAVGTGWLVGLVGAGGSGHCVGGGDSCRTVGSPPRRVVSRRQRVPPSSAVAGSHRCRGDSDAGSGRREVADASSAHIHSHGVGGFSPDLRRLVHIFALPCSAGSPIAVWPELVLPAARLSGVGLRRDFRRQVAPLLDTDPCLRALPTRPSRIHDHNGP